jgi:hypothetical protein
MKKAVFFSFFSMLFLSASVSVYGQFRATMHLKYPENEKIYQIFHDGENYRYELTEENEKAVVIVDAEEGMTYLLLPQKKVYQAMESLAPRSLSNDPVQTMRYLAGNFTMKATGMEVMNGFECEKREIHAGNKLINRAWYSDELRFPVKIEQLDQYMMELSEVTMGSQESHLFQVPDGYTLVDHKLRPVLPEPPPPEKWTRIEKTVPFSGSFEKGSLVEFTVQDTRYHQIKLSNNGEEPAKTVRATLRDGQELPDNEQGPLKYRTNKLHKGEQKQLTLSLKPGDVFQVKVFYGKMDMDVQLE